MTLQIPQQILVRTQKRLGYDSYLIKIQVRVEYWKKGSII